MREARPAVSSIAGLTQAGLSASQIIIPLIALPLPELLRLTDATSNSSRVFWASVVKAAAMINRSVVPDSFPHSASQAA